MLTGRKPFGETRAQIIAGLFGKRPIEPVKAIRPDIPEAISGIVGTMLQRERTRRYESASRVLAVLPDCSGRGRAELVAFLRQCRDVGRFGSLDSGAARSPYPRGRMIPSGAMERYKLEERIGAGGMGEVWRGSRTLANGTEERIAIKRILHVHAHEPDAIERFEEAFSSMGRPPRP